MSLADNPKTVKRSLRRRRIKIAVVLSLVLAGGLGLFLGLFFGLQGPEKVSQIRITGRVYESVFVRREAPANVKGLLTENAYAQASDFHLKYLDNDLSTMPIYSSSYEIKLPTTAQGGYLVVDNNFKRGSMFSNWRATVIFQFDDNNLISAINYAQEGSLSLL